MFTRSEGQVNFGTGGGRGGWEGMVVVRLWWMEVGSWKVGASMRGLEVGDLGL